MKQHNLENKSTTAKKKIEVANSIGLKDFKIYIRTDKLTTKQGIINLTKELMGLLSMSYH